MLTVKIVAITALNKIKVSPDAYEDALIQFVQDAPSKNIVRMFSEFVKVSKTPRFSTCVKPEVYEKLTDLLSEKSDCLDEISKVFEMWSDLPDN